jgi:hypothetical protein
MILLAAREDPAVVSELRRRAFDQPWILRDGAYAILALVEREDARLMVCLEDRHVTVLLDGLAVSDPFVSGACAAALAGIGFRSASLGPPEWLDRAVPDRLVRAVSGLEFHNDFSSLQRPATRRLSLISGESLASDGPAWGLWWSRARPTFRARRAVIEATPEMAASMRISWSNELGVPVAFRLLGPTASSEPQSEIEVLRITEAQARDLFTLLEQNGVFTAQRLPGLRGAGNLPGRSLEVGVAGQGKSFRISGSAKEAWFEALDAGLGAVRERNRWQRYPSPLRHQNSEDLWFEQAGWWDEDHTETERAMRMKTLVLEALPAMPMDRRESGIAELVLAYADPAIVEQADFEVLFGLLDQEEFFSPRAQSLLGLVLKQPGATEQASNERTALLYGLALRRFGDRGAEALAQIMGSVGVEAVRVSLHDQRALLRAVAARRLTEIGEAEDLLPSSSPPAIIGTTL